jgi:23S rRNA (pseudouridine1915-N3)-methyltransferase
VGATKSGFLFEGESEYLKRLKRYCNIETQWMDSHKISSRRSENEILRLEGELLLGRIPERSILVALDRQGDMLSSGELSKKLNQWQNQSAKEVIFVIGGSLGLDGSVLKKADLILSFSKMTFTHEMIRLLLFEQLYRAFTILNGEQYHK